MGNSKYEFTTTWFDNTSQGTWNDIIPQINPFSYLEIGSYEGRSTCFIIETIGKLHPIEVHAIDTWEGGVEHDKNKMDEVERRFDNNINTVLVELNNNNVDFYKHKGYSDKEMINLAAKGFYNHFDLIYIDGSHQNTDVLSDAILAFKLLKPNGYIIFDDYLWRMQYEDGKVLLNAVTKVAIDTFVNTYIEQLNIVTGVYTRYEQLIIQKK